MLTIHRTALRRRPQACIAAVVVPNLQRLHQSARLKQQTSDPRIRDLDHVLEDDFLVLREKYDTPKHPIILAHGLLGFDELHLAGSHLGIQYWHGITEALAMKGIEVITAAVPPSDRIEARAEKLGEVIERQAGGKAVNIIAHSMVGVRRLTDMHEVAMLIHPLSGLDARHMISRTHPPNVKVLSLTTVATPHRGSAFADYIFSQIGTANIPKLYRALEFFGLETGAFRQLTESYMTERFNPRTPDVEGVRYYSFGASFEPQLTSVFRRSHKIVEQEEGPNDGLVSVESSRWGEYKGTLQNVSHLDLINWTNRLRWYFFSMTGQKRKFNAIAFYLSIADMLAKEGL